MSDRKQKVDIVDRKPAILCLVGLEIFGCTGYCNSGDLDGCRSSREKCRPTSKNFNFVCGRGYLARPVGGL